MTVDAYRNTAQRSAAAGAMPMPGFELTVVIPTRNERDNVMPLYERLCVALQDVNWEVIFVDDDSNDGTRDAVKQLSRADRRVRLLHRIGRRGLSSACIEGIQASTAPFVAVMDGDLQHDESLLPKMFATLKSESIDVVVGSRYAEQGGVGEWSKRRALVSDVATRIGRTLLRVPIADPLSGFFMVRRDAFDAAVRNLSALGFKILIDLFASSPKPLQAKELPFQFRLRLAGESKLDALVAWDYLVLIADKLIGHVVPVRFVLFAAVGVIGILSHLLILWMLHHVLLLPFSTSQAGATAAAMVGNFVLNNWLTYRDQRLTGWRFVRGLVTFCLICSFGAVANIGVASFLYSEEQSLWWVAGIAGAAMSLVWNYAVSSIITWRAS
jgi:dolichol-phosphate mannosyltransferase